VGAWLVAQASFDPPAGCGPAARRLPTAGGHPTAMLPPGNVLVVGGGYNSSSILASAELYDPATGTWTATGSLATARSSHTATLLPDGKVLAAAGNDHSVYFASAELYVSDEGGPITLSAAKRKVGGINTVRLTWSGATSTDIDVYRDAVLIVTTANDGSYTDSTGDTGRARYTYKVCEAGTQTCYNEVTVRFPQ